MASLSSSSSSSINLLDGIRQLPPVFEILCRHLSVRDWDYLSLAMGWQRSPDFSEPLPYDSVGRRKREMVRNGKFHVRVKSLQRNKGEGKRRWLPPLSDSVGKQGCAVKKGTDILFIQEEGGYGEMLELSSYLGKLKDFQSTKSTMSDEYFIIEGEASKSKNKKKKVTVLVSRKGRGEKRRVFYLLYGEEFSSSSSASLPHLNRGAASFCDLTVIGHRLFYLSRQGMKLEHGRLPFAGSVSCHSLNLEEARPRRWDSAKAVRVRPDHNPSDYYESSDKLEWMLPGAPQDCFWQAKFGICGLAFASSAKVAGSPPGHGSGKLTLMCSGTVTHDLLQHLDRNTHHIERSRVEFTSNAALAVVTVRRSNSHAGEGELRVVDTRTGTTLHRVLYAYDEGPVWWGMLETPPQGSGEDAFFWLALWVSTARRIADKTFHFLCFPYNPAAGNDGPGPSRVARGWAPNLKGPSYPMALHCLGRDTLAVELQHQSGREDSSRLLFAELTEGRKRTR